jgi:hypothetical protein
MIPRAHQCVGSFFSAIRMVWQRYLGTLNVYRTSSLIADFLLGVVGFDTGAWV